MELEETVCLLLGQSSLSISLRLSFLLPYTDARFIIFSILSDHSLFQTTSSDQLRQPLFLQIQSQSSKDLDRELLLQIVDLFSFVQLLR